MPVPGVWTFLCGQEGIPRGIANPPGVGSGITYGPIANRRQVTNLPYTGKNACATLTVQSPLVVELVQPLPAKFANQEVLFHLGKARLLKNTLTVFGQPFGGNVLAWHSRATRDIRARD